MDFEKLCSIDTLDRRSLNLHTEFTSEGTVLKPDFTTTACFANVLKTGNERMNNTYVIRMHKEPVNFEDNFLFFTIDEINEYMKYIKELYDNFTYSIEDDESKDCVELTIHIDDLHFYHTFVLTFVRYLYEVNYAIMLNDAMELKRTFRFRNKNILSLMALVIDSWKCVAKCVSNDMSHFGSWFINMLPTDKVKERISILANDFKYKEVEHSWYNTKVKYFCMRGVTEILPYLNDYDKKYHECLAKLDNIDNYPSIMDKEYFNTLRDGFDSRYVKYRKNYKIIKDLFDSIKDLKDKRYGNKYYCYNAIDNKEEKVDYYEYSV